MGKKGNGCKMRRIPEADLIDEICIRLGCERLDEEWFKDTVERVNVRENCVEIMSSKRVFARFFTRELKI